MPVPLDAGDSLFYLWLCWMQPEIGSGANATLASWCLHLHRYFFFFQILTHVKLHIFTEDVECVDVLPCIKVLCVTFLVNTCFGVASL